ncbi:aldehyde dehydrogenase family protein [Cupriavidus pampae]|uniref:3-succinoylsemialdehyde-pyridine dehydrogenase n=1 Tax=Cupriavidus pampae TaxID=659251 RepID=A0ABN7XTW3_9BURK|nr:aldehyde dehydrogenase family protein [Cupriavidus pampae]CAG9164425.1 3-succinoylsemialdehyde-pyridine dehydrogenase [Cupriavidus pampae]
MQQRDKLYINGTWVSPHGTGWIDVIQSNDESVLARIPEGHARDAEDAIAAARAAFEGWAATPVDVRAGYLRKIAEGLKDRTEELARLIASEVGMPLKLARAIQVGGPVYNWGQAATLLEQFKFEEQLGNSLVVREPVGVVAAITPWNFPLNQITLKVAPALAAGCTVVLKPSEVAPLNAFVLAEVIEAAGLPPGVFNLVTGYGPVVGEVLASHPEVDMVSFTGSTRAGKRVSELAAQSVKRVALELGGKSASVILDDADFEQAVKGTINACYLNSGQTCSAHTRMLVPRARYDAVREIARKVVAGFTVGDPLTDAGRLGPLVSGSQKQRVVSYIQRGLDEGAELVAGGTENPDGLDRGFYVRPTVLGNVDPKATVAQEEIFGPVLSIICYDSEDDAVRIANDSLYGLGGGVWSGDEARALRVARRLRTGQVDINGGPFNMNAPFGGFKQSGNGREGGVYGLEEFLEYKSLQLKKQS